MGWSYCGTDSSGRPIGYSIPATCDWPGCDVEIDRGLSYLCGEMHGDGLSCNGYFCGDHRVFSETGMGERCPDCADMELVEDVMES